MAADGRTEAAGRRRNGRAGPGSGGRVAPLYARLPHGPHALDRAQVARHQRARIHGAMVEAVARGGYEATSVSQVIALAGVSRRSFYEHFANREACFLATFDVLARRAVRRMAGASGNGEPDFAGSLGAALRALVRLARTEPDPAALLALDALTVGPAGAARLRGMLASCEGLITRCARGAPDARPLPRPLVMGIVGGLHGALAQRLREPRDPPGEDLAEELRRWCLAMQPRSRALLDDLSRAAMESVGELASREGRAADPPARADGERDARRQLCAEVLSLAASAGYRGLCPVQVAERAGVPGERFFETFADLEDCFLEAHDGIALDLLGIAAGAQRPDVPSPAALRGVVAELLERLSANPVVARTIAAAAFTAGPAAAARNLDLLVALASRLVAGGGQGPAAQSRACAAGAQAPDPGGGIAVEATAGALLHTLACLDARGRLELLPAFTDHLAFIVLAPALGADAAVAELARARREAA